MTAGFEIFPIGIGQYEHHEALEVEAEVDQVVKLLEPFGGRLVPWDTPPERRDRDAIEERLRQWFDPGKSEYPQNGTVLYWVGHGSGGGPSVVLLNARSPADPAGLGVGPADLATAIRNRRAHEDHRAGWIVVIVDACLSARFVELLDAELRVRNDPPQQVLLIGTSAEDVTRLGRFSQALRNLLNDTYGGQAEISLWRLGMELAERYLPGCCVVPLQPGGATLRRPAPLPAGLSGPLDMMSELKTVLSELDPVERDHFISKGQGAESSELTWYFTGRRGELRKISDWLRARPRGLLVVTGDPGAGKSALLGYALAQSRPRLRALLDSHGLLRAADEADRPPDDVFTGGLLLSGMSVEEAAEAIARVAGFGTPPRTDDPRRLGEWLAGRARGQITLLVDGLDEARQPETVADHVLRRLAAVPGVRIVVGTRRAARDEPGQGILDALDAADGDLVEVARDPDGVRVYVEDRLAAVLGPAAERDAIALTAMRIGLYSSGFLFARLAVHEVLARPGLLQSTDEQDKLLTSDHRQLFAGVVERLREVGAVNAGLLRALAYAQGQGLPISAGVWAAVTHAVSGMSAEPQDFENFLQLAAPYIVQAVADGETVYRLAHRTFQEHFLADAPAMAETVLGALLELARAGPLHPYLWRHLSGHAAVAGMPGWRQLAEHHDVLDLLDARALCGDAVRSAFGRPGMPDEIAGIVGARNRLIRAGPADRRGVREIAMAQHAGTSVFPRPKAKGETDAPWSVRAAWLRPQQSHAVMEHRAGGPLHAIAAYTRAKGRATMLATGGDDATVRVWDPATGEQVHRLRAHRKAVRAVIALPGAAPRGRDRLASAGDDGTIRIWDPERGERLGGPLRAGVGAVRALAAVRHEDRILLAAGGNDRIVRLWDLTPAEPQTLVGHDHWVLAITSFIGENGRTLLATASRDKTVRIWDVASGTALHVLTGHTDWVLAVAAFSGRGGRTLLASASADHTVRIWDPADGAQVREPFTGHSSWVRDLAVFTGPDGGELLASVGDDALLRIWNPLTGQEIRHQPWAGHTDGIHAISAFQGTDHRTLLATASVDRSVRIWDPAAGPVTWDRSDRHSDRVNAVSVYHRNGRPQFASVSNDRTVRLWDPAGNQPLDRLTGVRSSIRAVTAVKKPGAQTNLLATAGNDGRIRIWDPAAGRRLGPLLEGHRGKVFALTAFAGPGKRTLLASVGTDRLVRLWDPIGHTTFGRPMEGHERAINAVTWLRGKAGRILLATGGDDRTVRIWDPVTHEQIADPIRLRAKVLSLISIAIDGGFLLAVGCADCTVRIMDPESGLQLGPELKGHAGGVSAMAMLPGPSRLLLSGSWDRTLRLWDPLEHSLCVTIPIGLAVTGLSTINTQAIIAAQEGVAIVDLYDPVCSGPGTLSVTRLV